MGEYIISKKKMKIQSKEALQAVQMIIDDADEALKDKSKKMKDSLTAKAYERSIAKLREMGMRPVITFNDLLAFPMGVLEIVGRGIASHIKSNKIQETKEILYKDALAKQSAILKALGEEKNADKERREYLNKINIWLQGAIKDLQHDLGVSS